MNIAYLFYGHSRTWTQCYESFFENVFSSAPGDIFIHTWDRVNSTSGSNWNGWIEELPTTDISSQIIDLNGIIKAYNPIDIIIEKDKGIKHFKTNLPHVSLPHLGVKNMLDSRLKVFNMAKQHKKYDKYFLNRMDIKYLSKFDKNELLFDELIISKSGYSNKLPLIFDLFVIGSEIQIEIKTNYINHIDEYWYNYSSDLYRYSYEEALQKYCVNNGIIAKASCMDYCAPRIDGKTTYW
tara:strand:+ start:846 stop:1559 length:714 start_codon:yes stop_codon:yes gene_type:complete